MSDEFGYPELIGEGIKRVGIQRCQLCGEPIGPLYSNDPAVTEMDPAICVVRCFACAATEEAEAITKDAATRNGDNDAPI